MSLVEAMWKWIQPQYKCCRLSPWTQYKQLSWCPVPGYTPQHSAWFAASKKRNKFFVNWILFVCLFDLEARSKHMPLFATSVLSTTTTITATLSNNNSNNNNNNNIESPLPHTYGQKYQTFLEDPISWTAKAELGNRKMCATLRVRRARGRGTQALLSRHRSH